MIDAQPPKSTITATDRPPNYDAEHKSARLRATLRTLWSSLLSGFATPPGAFGPFLEAGIDEGRGVRTIWARGLAVAGAVFWMWVAIGSGHTLVWTGIVAAAVLISAFVAWRWDTVGGWLFIAEALVLAAYLLSSATDRMGILLFSLPAAVIGLLFLTGRRSETP